MSPTKKRKPSKNKNFFPTRKKSCRKGIGMCLYNLFLGGGGFIKAYNLWAFLSYGNPMDLWPMGHGLWVPMSSYGRDR